MGRRMETGPIATLERHISAQDSLLRYCYLQLTDTSGFRGRKLYRGFESLPLRHAVWTAEKLGYLFAEMREQCPHFAIIPRQIGLQRTDCSASKVSRPGFSPEGPRTVRFPVGHQAKAMRSGTRIPPCRLTLCQRLGNRVRSFPISPRLHRIPSGDRPSHPIC